MSFNSKKFFRDIDSGFFNNSELLNKFDEISKGQDSFRFEILLVDLQEFIQNKLNSLILNYKPIMTIEQENDMVESLTNIGLHPQLLEILKEDQNRTPEEKKSHHINTELYSLHVARALLEDIIENYDSDQKKRSTELFYPKIGALFAQGLIYKKSFDYFYENKKFDSSNKLARYVQREVLQTDKSVRQYIGDTLSEKTGEKDFYKSLKMMTKIVEYCHCNQIEITDDFLQIYNSLNNPH